MNTITKKDKYCHINESRGYGNGVFKILAHHEKAFSSQNECTLQAVEGGEKFNMYTAHLYTTTELKRRSIQETRSAAQSIGRPKIRPGKKK